MKCSNHKGKDAVSACSLCGTALCAKCNLTLAGKNYCQKCADELVRDGAIVTVRKLYEILEEKRKHYRVHLLLNLKIASVENKEMLLKGILHNISSGGMAALSDKPVSINEIVRLSFVLPTREHLENLQGGVIRSEKIGEKYNLGFIFMNLGEKQKIIDDFLMDFRKKKYAQDSANMSNYLF